VYYPLIIAVVYRHLEVVIPLIANQQDSVLSKLDTLLFGSSPDALLIRYDAPALLTDILSLSYLAVIPAAFAIYVFCYLKQKWFFRPYTVGLATLYALGFIIYSCVPATGPIGTTHFEFPLRGFVVTKFNAMLVEQGSMKYDAFPSLHAAIVIYITSFAVRDKIVGSAVAISACFFVLLASLYLRYHYFVDIAAGCGIGALSWHVSKQGTLSNDSFHTSIT
jgi:hypothetical protein